MKKNIIIVSVILMLISCDETNYPTDGEKLSGGYTCRCEGVCYLLADNIFKQSIYGKITNYVFNKDYIILKQEPNRQNYMDLLSEELRNYRIILEGSMDHSKSNSIFTNFKYNSFIKKMSYNINEKDIKLSYFFADSLLKNDLFYKKIFENKINYWIVSHNKNITKKSKIYGPFTKNEYLEKRKELGIPFELTLN